MARVLLQVTITSQIFPVYSRGWCPNLTFIFSSSGAVSLARPALKPWPGLSSTTKIICFHYTQKLWLDGSTFFQAPDPPCSWLDRKGWSGGAKVQLKINIVEVSQLPFSHLSWRLRIFSFPGSFILEYFFWLQQGCYFRSLERGHQCFDRVCRKVFSK